MKRFIYLISPKKINNKFYNTFDKVLSYGNVKFFQLRLKNAKKSTISKIIEKIKKITLKNNVKFILNDNYNLALEVKVDGCHMGQLDGSHKIARLKLKKKILGITCHNSISLAEKASKDNADYLAFGSFFESELKPGAIKADVNILKIAKKKFKQPIVAIGGINNSNYKKLIKSGAKYIAISSYIWDNPKLKPEIAIRKFK